MQIFARGAACGLDKTDALSLMAFQRDHSQGQQAEDDELDRFCRLVAASQVHQQRLQSCASPDAILRLAQELRASFSRQTLRMRSRDLAAAYWPWAHKGPEWRRQFFADRPRRRFWV